MSRPVIGITADIRAGRFSVKPQYVDVIDDAGGLPMVLPPLASRAAELVSLCDGVILTGGDDPIMEAFGRPTHPAASPVDPRRQEADLAVLEVARRRRLPTLGVCLGMQYMGLVAGAALHQHLDEVLERPEHHKDDHVHAVTGSLGEGTVTSWHHQALADPGDLEVVATADDGVIEAVADPDHPFYVGVQWHPERTEEPALGRGLVERFITAARHC